MSGSCCSRGHLRTIYTPKSQTQSPKTKGPEALSPIIGHHHACFEPTVSDNEHVCSDQGLGCRRRGPSVRNDLHDRVCVDKQSVRRGRYYKHTGLQDCRNPKDLCYLVSVVFITVHNVIINQPYMPHVSTQLRMGLPLTI